MMYANKTISDKKVFNQMFKALRKQGFIAHQNYMCCQSCGWASIENNYGVADESNVVFYHGQDADSFDKDGYLNSIIYLAWQGDGNKIKEIAEMFSYKVKWDGSKYDRIGIIPNPKARELA